MTTTAFFAGDVNLLGVTAPEAPFARVADVLRQADMRFANLECSLYDPPDANAVPPDGIQASPGAAAALRHAGFDVVGTANNGNYGAAAIMSTLDTLASLGVQQTGSGADSEAAHRPAIVDANGTKIGVLQRTSVYWPMGHEAGDHGPGVAALQAHTAHRLPMHRTGVHVPPLNRPGVPLDVVTWVDPAYLARLREDIQRLRSACGVVVASHHWGLKRDVLQYMTEAAHAAIDAGADVVVGHGPHHPMAVEVYKGRPIFYSLSSFSFTIGHGGRRSGNWIGQMARVAFDGGKPVEAAFRWVRHTDSGETYFADPAAEAPALEDVARRSKPYGTAFTVDGDEVRIAL